MFVLQIIHFDTRKDIKQNLCFMVPMHSYIYRVSIKYLN